MALVQLYPFCFALPKGRFVNFNDTGGKQYALPSGQYLSELGAYHYTVTLTTSTYYSWWTIKTGA